MNKIFLAACVLVLSSAAHAKQILENTSMMVDTAGWEIWSGDELVHDSSDGDFTGNGSALVAGDVDGVTAIASSCIDVSHWVYLASFRAEASVKPYQYTSEAVTVGISVKNFKDTGCQSDNDFTTETRVAAPGEWTQISGEFSLLQGTSSIRLVLFSTNTPNGGSVSFDDASLTIDRQTEEIFDNPDLSENMKNWWLYWGDYVEYNDSDGHLTPGGSIRTEGQAVVVGSRGPYTGIRSVCVDVAERSPLDQYRVAASTRPDSSATEDEMGINVDFYEDSGCRMHFSTTHFFGESKPGKWSRLEGAFLPPEGTKGMIVRVRSNGVTEGGGALFDDVSLSLTRAVRQLWLIGVGEINNQKIKPFDLQYTRGGAFGDEFDPATIGRESLGTLELEFDGCNSGQISFEGDGFRVAYPIKRLAENNAVQDCEAQGFKNMGDRNGWMSGYWFGGPEREGEGFAIDVVSGGEQAIVTWYTYLPNWGADAPR